MSYLSKKFNLFWSNLTNMWSIAYRMYILAFIVTTKVQTAYTTQAISKGVKLSVNIYITKLF